MTAEYKFSQYRQKLIEPVLGYCRSGERDSKCDIIDNMLKEIDRLNEVVKPPYGVDKACDTYTNTLERINAEMDHKLKEKKKKKKQRYVITCHY